MSTTMVKLETGRELKKLCAKLAQAMSETVGSLVGRELSAVPGDVGQTDSEALLASLRGPHGVVRGSLDKDYAGRKLLILFELTDAIAMSGLLMMSPDHVIEEHRQRGKLEGEDLEAFGELGNVLCSGLGNVLRDAVANIDIRLQDTGVIAPSLDAQGLLPTEPLVVQRIKVKVGAFPESTALLVLDKASAETWNKGPLSPAPQATEPTSKASAAPADAANRGEDSLEDIPAAPIRGRLHAYVSGNEAMRVLRRSCRRTGLEVIKHPPAEIPNPAAHKDDLVLMDAPLNDPKRFDWCRRIKEYEPATKVLLLLHHPSRERVKRAFLAGADVILGLPLDEAQLTLRLGAMLSTATT